MQDFIKSEISTKIQMKKIFIYSLILISFAMNAQKKDSYLPKANDEYAKKNYADAEADYRISQSKSPGNAASTYNLGNSIYAQNQAAEAGNVFLKATKEAKTRPEKHKAWHNLGNACMKNKDYASAVEAYKNALINDPSDEQSRYNFALAKDALKNNPPPKDDKNKDKNKDKDKDKKDDKKDKNDKDKKDDKGDKDKDKKDGDKDKDKGKPKDDKNGQKPKPQEGGISKQRLENLLDAVNNEEKKIQDKVNANKVKGKPVQTEKDW